MSYTLVPSELIVDGAITSAKLDTNISISGTLGVTGELTLATHLNMGDNDKIKIGTGGDLEIYHDGSNSYIANSTGNIYIADTNGAVHIQAKLNEESIVATADGAVTLYHDNSAKLATASGGVTVTGTLSADDLEIDSDTLSVDASNNRVGIGTTSPRAILDLKNSGDGTLNTTASNYQILLEAPQGTGDYGRNIGWAVSSGTVNASINAFDAGASNATGLAFSTGAESGMAEAMRIDSSGKVGIGETSISQNLDVKTSTVNTGVLFYNTNTTSGASVPLFLASEAGGSTTNISIENAGASNMLFRTGATSKDGFGTERMRINSAGNVGINSTSPQTKFVVQHTDGQNGIEFSMGATESYIQSYNRNTNDYSDLSIAAETLRFRTNDNSERMRIDANGNLGLGTTPPTDTHTVWTQLFAGTRASLISENTTGAGGLDGTWLTDNMYVDSDTGAFANITTDESSAINQNSGEIKFYSQASGSAGAGITLSEKMRINNAGHLVLQEGNGIFADTGRTGDVQITGSFTNVLNFNSIGGTGAGTGFYLVTAVRTGASVGTHIVLLVGVSTTSAAFIYATLASASLVAEFSNDTLRLRETGGSTINVHVTAVPIGITGND